MATNPEADDDDFELPEEEQEEPQPEADGGEEDGEEIVTFEGEPVAAEPETPIIKHLRDQLRERNRQLAETRRAAPQAPAPKIEVGPRPKIEEFDYDQEAFDAATDKWIEQRDAASQQQNSEKAAEQARIADLDKVRTAYFEAKSKLPYADAQDAEDTVFAELDGPQQLIIAKYAAKPALLIYALGKNPTKLAQIAGESDPIKLGQIITRMEATLTTTRRRAPDPEEIPAGRTVSHSNPDKALEKLEKEAARTGDRSAVIRHKKSLKTA